MANQEARKSIENVFVILNKIDLSLFTAVYGVFSPNLFPAFDHFGVSFCEKQIDVSFLCVCPLTDDKFHHNIANVTAEALACSSWFD